MGTALVEQRWKVDHNVPGGVGVRQGYGRCEHKDQGACQGDCGCGRERGQAAGNVSTTYPEWLPR